MPRLLTLSLLILCLAVVCARPAVAQSLLDGEWMAQATPAAVQALLDRGADPKLQDKVGKLPVDHAAENEHLTGTAVYWRLHDAKF